MSFAAPHHVDPAFSFASTPAFVRSDLHPALSISLTLCEIELLLATYKVVAELRTSKMTDDAGTADDSVVATPGAPPSAIAHFSVKAPAFYRKSPETWFRQLESQYHLAGITSSATKFHHALAALPEDVACDAPDTTDYDVLKAAVLDSLRANKHQLIEDALAAVELGDRRPSQLVTDIKRRFADVGLKADDAIVKSRLITALPPTIRAALVGHECVALDTFAKIADSMLAVSAASTPFTVAKVEMRPTASAPADSRRTLPRPFYRDQRPKVCNAHIYYGTKARTCRRWCQWPESSKPRILSDGNATPRQSRPTSPQPEN